MSRSALLLCASLLLASCGYLALPKPSALRTSPAFRNEVLKKGAGIWIEFPEGAERDAAGACMSVRSGPRSLAGNIEWTGSRAEFISREDFSPGVRYILVCSGDIPIRSGRIERVKLSVPFFYLSDSVRPFFAVSSRPLGGETIEADRAVSLAFSEALDPLSVTCGIELSPDRDWDFLLLDGDRTLELSSDRGWENFSPLTVNLTKKLLSAAGQSLSRETAFTFWVSSSGESPRVLSVRPALKDWRLGFPALAEDMGELSNGDAIRISFSDDMDSENTGDAIRISPALSGDLVWDGERDAVFLPEQGFSSGVRYCLSISSQAKSREGRSMPEVFSLGFASRTPFLRLLSLDGLPGDGFPREPPFSPEPPIAIDIGEESHSYTFGLRFSDSFSTAEKKTKAAEKLSLRAVFPENCPQPNLEGASWPTDNSLILSYGNLSKPEAGSEVYYRLSLSGGKNGITSSSGSYLEGDMEVFLCVR
jgi:hypothetical protein